MSPKSRPRPGIWRAGLRRRVATSLLAIVAAASWAGTAAADRLLAITFDDELVTIDPQSGVATLVGGLDSSMVAFGLDFRGSALYALDQIGDRIRQIDPDTGATLDSIDVGQDFFSEGALAFRSDGLGFAVESDGDLYEFDITLPGSTQVASNLPINIDGLAFTPTGDLLAFTSPGSLLSIDEDTGLFTDLGNLGLDLSGEALGGMAFDSEGNLFIVDRDRLYSIDVLSVTATLVAPITGFDRISGIAFIPEPGTAALLATGLAGLGLRGRRSQRRRER